jgi:hypothetical protein
MMATIEKLFYFFGYVGMASIAVWICAVALMLAFAVFWRSSRVCWTALAMAVVGLALANVNSYFVSDIRIDLSEELIEATKRADEETAAEAPKVESSISAEAEDALRDEAAQPSVGNPSDTDADPNADTDVEDQEGSAAELVAPQDPVGVASDEPAYDYRQTGKVSRTDGKQTDDKMSIDTAEVDEDIVLNVRTMKDHEVMHANRLDRLNLFFARSTLYFGLVLSVIDYFRRFNSTFGCYLPLPVAGRLVDSLFPKTHTVADATHGRDWKRFLEAVVRKGETFVLFTTSDPWSEQHLSRLPKILRRANWRLEKVVTDDDEVRFDDEFMFESAWFGRYCFVVESGGESALTRLTTIVELLELRRSTRASSWQTLNLVWSLNISIPEELLSRLLPLCDETNTKLIVTQPFSDENLSRRFDEVYAEIQ